MTRDNITEFMRTYNIENISENKWKLGNFIFSFTNDTITISGRFFYSLAKKIFSEDFYPNEILASLKEPEKSFENFLTSTQIEIALNCFSSDCATFYNYDYDTYSRKYDNLKEELLKATISKYGKEILFLRSITITSISSLVYTINCIKKFAA